MAAEPISYIKLPGRGLRRAIAAISAPRCRLWLGPDHLLAVDSTMASESYRRFYFRDIEGFVIRRTAGRQIWNWALVAGVLITAGPLFAFWYATAGSGTSLVSVSIIAAFWLVFILINTFRGPTCQTHVRTAVQLEQLPSLSRLPIATKVLGIVRPIIEAAQGRVTEEEYSAAPWVAPDHAAVARFGPVKPTTAPVTPGSTKPHAFLSGLLLAEGVLAGLAYALRKESLFALGMIATLCGFLVCIVALVRQSGRILPSGLRRIPKVALAFYSLEMIAGFVFTVTFSVRHIGTPVLTGMEIIGEPGFPEAALVSGILAAVLGLVGLVLLAGSSRQSEPGADASAS